MVLLKKADLPLVVVKIQDFFLKKCPPGVRGRGERLTRVKDEGGMVGIKIDQLIFKLKF